MYVRGPKQLQNPNRASSNTRCQRCLKLGHHTYECSNPRPYVPRPSRSKQLAMGGGPSRDKPSVEVPEEFKANAGVGLADKILKAKEVERAKEVRNVKGKKSATPSSSASGSGSESDSEDDSEDSQPRRTRRATSSSSDDSHSPSPSPRRGRRGSHLSSEDQSKSPSPMLKRRGDSPRSQSPAKRQRRGTSEEDMIVGKSPRSARTNSSPDDD